MVPYFLLLLIPLFCQMFLALTKDKILVGNERKQINYQNVVLPIFFILFLLMLSLRDQSLGRDLPNYNSIFSDWGHVTFSKVFSNWQECLFHFYCWLFYNYISTSFQIFVSVTAIISVLPIFYVYNKNRTHGYLKIAVFVNMSTFIMLFSGIRQGLAIAVGILAYQALIDKKYLKFLIFVIIASFIHHTGFMTLLLLPLCKFKIKKLDYLWIVPSSLVVFAFRNRIFNTLAGLLADSNEKYSATAETNGAFGSFVLFLLFTSFYCVIIDEFEMDEEAYALKNILIFATIMQMFASVNTLAMRMNYYFIILIPLALGKCLNYTKVRYIQAAKVGEMMISTFFTFYFFYTVYKSTVTGISTLDTIPYVPFWEGVN